jgi:hypothetical protein
MTDPDNDPPVDGLLAALDQFTNTIYWHQHRHHLNAAAALVEAIDAWLAEHAAEHNRSEPFSDLTRDGDPLATMLVHLDAAAATLTARERPELSVALALTEALDNWTAEQATEHHHSQPFQRPGVYVAVEATSS